MFLLPFLLLFHFFFLFKSLFQTHSINSINLGFVSILLARRRLSGDGCGWQMATSQSNSCNYSIRRSMPPDQTWERMRIGSEGATFFSHSNICDSWNISDVLDSWDISGSPRSVDSSVFVCFRLFSAINCIASTGQTVLTLTTKSMAGINQVSTQHAPTAKWTRHSIPLLMLM